MIYLIDPKDVSAEGCKKFCATLCADKITCPLDLIQPLYGIPY